MYRRARSPTSAQAAIIEKAGLNPREWLVLEDGRVYMKLTDRGIEQRDEISINKSTMRLVQIP